MDARARSRTACALQSPAGNRNDLAGNAGGGWRGKKEHGLGDIFALGPTLQIFRFHRGNVGRRILNSCLGAVSIKGTDAVVNAVSAYVEKGGVTFEAVHVQGCRDVAREAVAAEVARVVLVSGIGADPDSKSPYIRARGRGELSVQQAFPGATIIRPGAMFGPGDALFGRLADLARLLPVLPLIGGGARDCSQSLSKTWQRPWFSILADPGTAGRVYELVGPGVYTLRELVEFTLRLMRQTPIAHTGALCRDRDPGATIRAPAKPTAHHWPGRPSQGGQCCERYVARSPRAQDSTENG